MDGIEGQIEHQRLERVALPESSHGPVGQQVGGPPFVQIRLAVLPPVQRAGFLADVGEVVDGSGVFAVVQVPTAILGLVFGILPNHRTGNPVDHHVGLGIVETAEVPFAAHEGLVPGRAEGFRQGVFLKAQTPGVVHGRADGIATGQQGRPGDTAHGGCVKTFQSDALAPQTIHVGRLGQASVSPEISEAVIVGHHDDHVGTGRGHGHQDAVGGAQGRGSGIGHHHFDRMDLRGLGRRGRPFEAPAGRVHRRPRRSHREPIRQALRRAVRIGRRRLPPNRAPDPDLPWIRRPRRENRGAVCGTTPGTGAAREPNQHLVVEHQVGRPDEAGSRLGEDRGKARVGRLVVHTHFSLGVDRSQGPDRSIEGRLHPVGRHRIVESPSVGAWVGIQRDGR